MIKKLIYAVALCLNIAAIGAKPNALVQHFEPSLWWTGMKNNTVQLLFHGTNLSQAEISFEYPGVSLLKRVNTNNPNYSFLYIQFAPETRPGKCIFNVKLKNKTEKIVFEIKNRTAGGSQRKGFGPADAIYLLMPDRFANGNKHNDSISGYWQGVNRKLAAARHGGDIDGIIQHIPYIADLGVTTLWTTPLFENNDTSYSYHHYGCTNYYKIDPRFGKNEDYPRMVKTCHDNGLKVLIDVVPNHCCSQHWWLKDKPDKDWFNEWPQYTSSNYRMTVWSDPHAAQADLRKLTKGWFAPNMPDFNLNNQLLFDYLSQVYIYWIEYANIDGMRVDTYPYNDIHVASAFIKTILSEYPGMTVVGECWVKSPSEIAFYQSDSLNNNRFDSHLNSVMDFCLKDALATSFNEEEKWDTGLIRFYNHFAQDFVYPDPNRIMNFVDNHDIDRFSTAINHDIRKYKMAMALLCTVRGYPQIYYGTEIMLDGIPGDYQGHRFDFPGGWADDLRNAFNAEGRSKNENELFNYLKALLWYRKNNPVLQTGKMIQFIPENGVYVFFRYNDTKKIMIIANNNDSGHTLNMKRFDEMLESNSGLKDIITNQRMKLTDKLELPAKSVQIMEVE